DRSRSPSRDTAKHARHVALVGEAGQEGELGETRIGLAEPPLDPPYTEVLHVVPDARAHMTAERTGQEDRMDARVPSQLGDRDPPVELGVDALEHGREPARLLRAT